MAVDTVAGAHGVEFTGECRSLVGEYASGSTRIILVKPATSMNNSGRAARAVLKCYDVELGDMMFVCDDINLPVGKIRIRGNGSSGGHRGLESATEALGSCEFPRLRIGVGSPGRMSAEEYVLKNFRKSEIGIIEEAMRDAAEALELWISGGVDEAMNRFN